ncbi:bifunctional alpha,alpha-trehalose-phosphate synthase (UDP-forming)/trehalose-phosphatase [soil metagenome]
MSKNGKLIIISTRLPVSVRKENGIIKISPSSGGLATGMTSVSESRDSIWVGWPGIASEQLSKQEKEYIIGELKKYKCHPVFLTQDQINKYYSGYSNATIWPLFHYFVGRTVYDDSYWQAYQTVNELFMRETRQFVTGDSQIWVHDYQLMLLPALLRQKYKHAQIGFFLHTPFPSFEVFRVLPERESLLKGMLGADLIGFHTYDYASHFLSSLHRSLGLDKSLREIQYDGRIIRVDAFPIGINYKKFAKAPKKGEAKQILKAFNLIKEKTKLIVSVDRADYTKGIPARLDAYEQFLTENPKYIEKTTLVLLTVPTRTDVKEYQDLRIMIEQKVSHINGVFSTIDWMPIVYRYQSLPFDELSALYAMADVMLVTPLRDGMNLVAKEYVASHHKAGGVLVLSEMAGAASELTDAVLVNPYNRSMVVEAIKTALQMPMSEQKKRMKAMQKRISEYTITRWAHDFITQLGDSGKITPHAKYADESMRETIRNEYKDAKKRLILLDYDGTLQTFVSSPDASHGRPTIQVKTMLKKLSKDPLNNVVIVSGRPKKTVDSFFKGLGLGMVAEHGAWISKLGRWVKSGSVSQQWKKTVKPVLEAYTTRTPGAEIEEKDFSLVWHFRNVSPDLAYVRSKELNADLSKLLKGTGIEAYQGQKIIDIKPRNMHKGSQVAELLGEEHWDFILAIGDDYTDEDMFRVLPRRAYSFHVGDNHATDARYQLNSVKEVIAMLERIVK